MHQSTNEEKEKRSIQDLIKSRDYKGLATHLKDGVSAYLESDTYKNYLDFVSQFHKYSSKNVRLILDQKPDARYVASLKKWNEMDRKVKKGAKALYVYAPNTVIKKDREGNPVKDDEGNIIKEQRFFLVPVFDVSQTQGTKELPKPIYNLEDNLTSPKRFSQLFKGLSELSPVPVRVDQIDSEANGIYRVEEKEIIIQEGLGHEMTLKTLAHEIAHALLHADSQVFFGDPTYRQQEFEAESLAYIICNHLGIDSSSYTFGYLSSWTTQGKDIDSFTESLERITQQAQQIINHLDQKMAIIYGIDPPENKFEERLALAQLKRQLEEKDISIEKRSGGKKESSETSDSKSENNQSTEVEEAQESPKANRPQLTH